MEIYNKEDTHRSEISGCIITNPGSYELDTIPSGCHDDGSIQDGRQETPEQKNRYRTKGRAKATEGMPDKIPVITSPSWEYALSFHQNEYSFLFTEPGDRAGGTYTWVSSQVGMYGGVSPPNAFVWVGNQMQAFTQGTVPDVDLPTLHYLYGLILKKWSEDTNVILERYADDPRQMLSYNTTFYIPDFIRAAGITSNANKATVQGIIKKIEGYSDIIGVVKEQHIGRGSTYAYYPVMVFIGYDESDNTITFTSPFMNRIVQKTLYDSIRYDKHGNAMRSKSGRINMRPSHSYRINSGILKERNKRAIEVACIVAALIDKAGDQTAHIRFRTIIDRFEQLKQDIENASSTYNKNRILRTTFSKTWEFLEKYSDLPEKYKNIKLPDPNDKDAVPTMKTLERVIAFPHEGRIKKLPQNNQISVK